MTRVGDGELAATTLRPGDGPAQDHLPVARLLYDATTGECMTMPGAQLRRLPLRVEDGVVWVRAVGG